MSLLDRAHEGGRGERHHRYTWTGRYTTSNSEFSFFSGTSAANVTYSSQWHSGSTSISQGWQEILYLGIVGVAVNHEEYDPAFVERVLKADAAANEATFNNVIDLMDWLERD